MDKKPNFSQETIELARLMNHGFCMNQNCLNASIDYHHRMSNTKLNNKNYPLFLQSIFNCFPICRKCHNDYGLFTNIKITEQQARAYENWLKQFKEGNTNED